jgi:glycine/D-amino acid oxidase-like deaminating enzyme/nitrite reductase/ring-hydroxylating ferredoxin subunit
MQRQDTGARSLWLRERAATGPRRPQLTRDLEVDVAIAGGGITGLSLAALLCGAGRRVAVVERERIGAGTTGHSTAHLTVALDTDYCTLAQRFGEDALRQVIESVERAIDEVEARALKHPGGCGFRRVPGFRYAEDAGTAARLEADALCAQHVGIEVERLKQLPIPLPCAGALRFERQAELDPVAYCDALLEQVVAAGGQVFEASPVVEADDHALVTESGARVRAAHVVEATHTPLGLVASIQTRLGVYTSYVLAARLQAPIERGLYWDCADPYHYLRAVDDDARLVLFGGEDHRTGREPDPEGRLRALEAFLRARLPVETVVGGWSHEFFEPADGLPYIGLLPGSSSHYVASGYSGTGIGFGTVAALLLRDLVLQGTSPWQELYTPSRLKPLAAGPSVLREGLGVAWRLIADRVRRRAEPELLRLEPGDGSLLRIEGEQVAAYRDPAGELHLLSPRCTHLGCIVAWNRLQKTWDCPCHGGRFHATGEPLYGPPVAALAPADERPDASPDGGMPVPVEEAQA